MDISIIVPFYNECDNVELLLRAIHTALADTLTYELILVDDGSNDSTLESLRRHAPAGSRIVALGTNYGQSTAIAVGIQQAQAEWIAMLDGDLQNDPGDILPMLKRAQSQGYDAVMGVRAQRRDNWLRCFPSRCANALVRSLTGVMIRDLGCTLRVVRTEYLRRVALYGELHRFIALLVAYQGARVSDFVVAHHPRQKGVSKYEGGWTRGIAKRTLAVLADTLWLVWWHRYRDRPLHCVLPYVALGAVCSFFAVILGVSSVWIISVWLISGLIVWGGIAQLLVQLAYERQLRESSWYRVELCT